MLCKLGAVNTTHMKNTQAHKRKYNHEPKWNTASGLLTGCIVGNPWTCDKPSAMRTWHARAKRM
jgi:hypothetical protein